MKKTATFKTIILIITRAISESQEVEKNFFCSSDEFFDWRCRDGFEKLFDKGFVGPLLFLNDNDAVSIRQMVLLSRA